MLVEFTFPGPPVPASRPRVTRTGHAFTEPKYAEYKKALATALKAEYGYFAWDIPAPGSKERSKWLKANRYTLTVKAFINPDRGDVDNYLKCAADAITQAGLIGDDSQIIIMTGMKYPDKQNPRLEITLEKMP